MSMMRRSSAPVSYTHLQLKGSLKTDWSAIMCGTCMSFVPGVVFYLLGQRYFVEGIVMTGMKN